MSLTQALIAEIKQEGESTRRILERVPVEKFDWKPHEKSMSLKSLATHIAHLSSWPALVTTTDQLDFQNNNLEVPQISETEDLIALLEKGTRESTKALENIEEEKLNNLWALKSGEQVIFEMPKIAVIRSMSLNHLVHHRGQLSVYLRLLDIPVPGMYGPSADEK